jgi:hypothetical protein
MCKIIGGRTAALGLGLAPMAGHKHHAHKTPTPSPSSTNLPFSHTHLPLGLGHPLAWALVILAVLVVGGVVKFMLSGSALRAGSAAMTSRFSLSLRARLWLRLHPGPGFAQRWELLLAYGLRRPRKDAKRLRPSLPRLDRWFGDPRAYAVYLGVHRMMHRLYVGLETGLLLIGVPRSGKSSWLAGRIVDAPGPVMVTSLRGDLVKNTIALRSAPMSRAYRPLAPLPSILAAAVVGYLTGWNALFVVLAAVAAWLVERLVSARFARRTVGEARPVSVLDPQNVAGAGATLPFSPVPGCADPLLARSTAAYMVDAELATGVQNAQFWENSAAQVLRAMLHAADLGAYTLLDVQHWVQAGDETPLRVLRSDARAQAGYADTMEEFLDLPEETRKGVIRTLGNVLDFMSDPRVASAVCSPMATAFDVDELLRANGTLYMVADDKAHSTLGPLFAALAGRVMDRAHDLAAESPAERLDPVLTVILDEVADTCPGPLYSWARTSAGWGIVLMAAVHNPDQLVTRWGDSVAKDIWSSLTTKIAWGGQQDQEHASMLAFLAGYLRVRNQMPDNRGGFVRAPGFQEVPIATATDMMDLPRNYALVKYGSAKSTVIRTERSWKRKDIKRGRRLFAATAATAAAEAKSAPTGPLDRFDDEIEALVHGKFTPPPAPRRSDSTPPPAPSSPPPAPRRNRETTGGTGSPDELWLPWHDGNRE